MDRLSLSERLQQATEVSDGLWQDLDHAEKELEQAQIRDNLTRNDMAALEVELIENPGKEFDVQAELLKVRSELAEADQKLRQAESNYLALVSEKDAQDAIAEQTQKMLDDIPSGPHAKRIASHKRHRQPWQHTPSLQSVEEINERRSTTERYSFDHHQITRTSSPPRICFCAYPGCHSGLFPALDCSHSTIPACFAGICGPDPNKAPFRWNPNRFSAGDGEQRHLFSNMAHEVIVVLDDMQEESDAMDCS